MQHTVACVEVLLNAQVVHHPTVLAAYGEGRKWTFEGDAEVKSKFWGRSIELTPVGVLKLTFHDGEVFSWSKVCNQVSLSLHSAVLTCLGMELYCAWWKKRWGCSLWGAWCSFNSAGCLRLSMQGSSAVEGVAFQARADQGYIMHALQRGDK